MGVAGAVRRGEGGREGVGEGVGRPGLPTGIGGDGGAGGRWFVK